MTSDRFSAAPSIWQVWWLGARPKTLWAAVAPVVIGGALAANTSQFYLPPFLAALLGGVFIQIGTNLVNDLVDYQKGVDSQHRLGPLRITQAGLATPLQMRATIAFAFGIAFILGIYLVQRGGLPIVIIGLASILFGVMYTAGPVRLADTGFAEFFVFVFFGPVAVAGTYYVTTLSISFNAIAAGISPGLFSTAILVVNNIRDIETDRSSGRRTLAVRFGRRFSEWHYLTTITLGLLYPIFAILVLGAPVPTLLASMAVFAAVPVARIVLSGSGATLNRALSGTGMVLGLYGLLYSIGLML